MKEQLAAQEILKAVDGDRFLRSIDQLEKACLAASGHHPIEIMSGAFHDAINLVDHCPTGMIFVPSIGGVSHNAAEATKADDLVLGVRALAYALVSLGV